jgi:hypothetical protein
MVRRCRVHGYYDARHSTCPVCHYRERESVSYEPAPNFAVPDSHVGLADDTTFTVQPNMPDSSSFDFGGGGGFSGGGGGSDF